MTLIDTDDNNRWPQKAISVDTSAEHLKTMGALVAVGGCQNICVEKAHRWRPFIEDPLLRKKNHGFFKPDMVM